MILIPNFAFRSVADFLAYDLLYDQIDTFILYPIDDWLTKRLSAKKARERWLFCTKFMYHYINPALEVLFLRKYQNQKQKEKMGEFVRETIEFRVRKIQSLNRWHGEVLQDIIKRLRSITFVVGYPEDLLSPTKIEEIYGQLVFDDTRNNVEQAESVYKQFKKIQRERASNKLRKFVQLASSDAYGFNYIESDNILCKDFIQEIIEDC